MTNQKYIPLKKMINDLGHDNPNDKLSNWVRQNIKEKEGFHAKYVALAKRPKDPVMISEEARTLVDNLCHMYPYMDFFPRNSPSLDAEKVFKAYRDLLSGEYKYYLEQKASKLHGQLLVEKDLNIRAIARLSQFIRALQSVTEIDIERQSIRELMVGQSKGLDLLKRSPHELSCWNTLVDLRMKSRNDPKNPELYREMAEVLYDLRLLDQCLQEVEKAIELEPEDGIAWAIKAKVLLMKFLPAQNEHHMALAMTDFAGHIPSPITSEERWINERVEESAESVEELRSAFVQAAMCSLENWPRWEHQSSEERVNYMPNVKLSGECGIDIKREWLFFHLIMKMRPIDLFSPVENKSRVLLLYKTFRPYGSYAFPSLSLGLFSKESSEEQQFQIKLTAFMAQISKDIHAELLDSFVTRFKEWRFDASSSMYVLSTSLISEHFWQYLGAEGYAELYSVLADYKKTNDEIERLSVFSRKVVSELKSIMKKPVNLFERYECDPKPWAQGEQAVPATAEQVASEFNRALMKADDKIQAMDGLIDRDRVGDLSDPNVVGGGYGHLLVYLALIEFKLRACPKAEKILNYLMSCPVGSTSKISNALECCLSSEDGVLLLLFEKFWNHELCESPANFPEEFFCKAQQVVDEKCWDKFQID